MINKDVIIGFILGLISVCVGVILYIAIFSDDSIRVTIEQAFMYKFFGKLVSLGALLNLGLFFFFLKKNQDNRAKGVLIATVIVAIIFMVNKF